MSDDAEHIRSVVLECVDRGKNVVLAANSYGGFVATVAVEGTTEAERKSNGKRVPGSLIHLIYIESEPAYIPTIDPVVEGAWICSYLDAGSRIAIHVPDVSRFCSVHVPFLNVFCAPCTIGAIKRIRIKDVSDADMVVTLRVIFKFLLGVGTILTRVAKVVVFSSRSTGIFALTPGLVGHMFLMGCKSLVADLAQIWVSHI